MDLKKLKEKTVDINVGEYWKNQQKYSLQEKNMWLFLVT